MGLTGVQIAELWDSAGGTVGWQWLAMGIAMAESRGTPTAQNPTDHHTNGSLGSWGLWQIGSTHGPGGFGTRTQTWIFSLFTPAVNASYAVSLSGGGNDWDPWSGDPLWNRWNAAGRPYHPSATIVARWLAAIGITNETRLPVGPSGTTYVPGPAPTVGQVAMMYDMYTSLRRWTLTITTSLYHGLQWIEAAMDLYI